MNSDNIKQMITCAIHLGRFNDPILLKCQHAFCRRCIINCVRNANLEDCPLCRTKIDYTIDELNTLNSSLIHKQLVDTYQNDKPNTNKHKLANIKKTVKLKISLLGSTGSGKSSIMRHLAGFPYVGDIASTVGVDTVIIDVETKDYLNKVYLWDTAGQEIFRTIIKSYYRNSKGIILVFDVTDTRTFYDVESWLNEIKVNCRDEDLVIALVANKIDLDDKRSITRERAKTLADRYNLLYFETSAKTGASVRDMLERLVSKINSIMEFSNVEEVISTSTIHLNQIETNKEKKCSC